MIVCVEFTRSYKARNARTTICHCFQLFRDLKIKKNDVYQRDPVRFMLQFSIFPASATKIQKYLLRT